MNVVKHAEQNVAAVDSTKIAFAQGRILAAQCGDESLAAGAVENAAPTKHINVKLVPAVGILHHEVAWQPDAVERQTKPAGYFKVDHPERDRNPRAVVDHVAEEAVAGVVVVSLVARETQCPEEIPVQVVDDTLRLIARLRGRGRRLGKLVELAYIGFDVQVAQIVRPGAPVIYGGFTSNVDMKSGAPAFGTPEYTQAALAGGQLTRKYGVPYRSSNVNASNHPDAQAAYESQMSLWGALMGGCHFLLHGAGWLEGGLTASYEKFIIDVEMLQMMAAFSVRRR